MKKLFRPHNGVLGVSTQDSEFQDFDNLVVLLKRLYSTLNITRPEVRPAITAVPGSDLWNNRPQGWTEVYTIRASENGWLLGYLNCDPTKDEPQKMTDSIEELEAKIAILKAEVAAKKKIADDEIRLLEKQEFERETPARRFAKLLHECTCRANHTDGCSWHYETFWGDYAHKDALERAQRILKALPLDFTADEHVDRIANAFAGYDVVKRLNTGR